MVAPAWPEARVAAHGLGAQLATGHELVPLDRSTGRTLATDVIATAALPGFDTSAMDGWAVAAGGPWTLMGTARAGAPWVGTLDAGQAVSIATGTRVPPGADAIVRSEDGTVGSDDIAGSDGRLTSAAVVPGRDIRPMGEECSEGEVLARAGAVVTPALAGLAAAVGHDALDVRSAPSVSVIVFGDEIAFTGRPGSEKVRDSLGPQLPAWLQLMGSGDVVVSHARDTLEAHVAALDEASSADIIVTTGGTARGPVDYVRAAIAARGGSLMLDTVAVRPGHPMLLATMPGARDPGGEVPVLGLPGNPQSAIIALVSLGWPLLSGMLGRPLPPLGSARLEESLAAPAREHRLVAGMRGDADVFSPSTHLGSAMMRGLVDATGFAVLPPGGAASGELVGWQPLPLSLTHGGAR